MLKLFPQKFRFSLNSLICCAILGDWKRTICARPSPRPRWKKFISRPGSNSSRTVSHCRSPLNLIYSSAEQYLRGRAFHQLFHPLSPQEESKEVQCENINKDQLEGVTMRVLNVAEKNDASKRIAGLLSNGRSQTRNTHSVYNKIYQFPFNFQGRNCDMLMTSVSGHLLGFDFDSRYRKWWSCDPVQLFDAPVVKTCLENFQNIKRTLEEQARQCDILVIWTDCDREGEGIGYEIIDVCTAINPRLDVYRAKFSELTPTAINRAWRTLERPNKNLSDAVDVRSELDLRIGAAFTRFQTMRLKQRFPDKLADRLISYGSCQFPTLGFVVERYKAIQDFVPEDFWKIEVSHKVDNLTVDFNWARVRLFNKLAVQILFEKCLDNPEAKVLKVQSKPKSKWRPVALDTVEFEKLASRKLRINAKEAMKIAEKLYTQGIISYPRTETNIFPQGLDLRPLIEGQTESRQWGQFAERLNQNGPNPRNGKNTDQAHPPIHPTRFDSSLQGNDARVYELIVRHFLACCSKDAIGRETTVEIEIAEERFVGHGLQILERNYLEVYIYDKWSDKELPNFTEGERFRPTKIDMAESQTAPPNLLTEADLISLMEKHGIGTDATHAEHIETIKNRLYVGVQDDKFVPGQLGMGLVEGYDTMGFEMSKPHLRAELEADLKRICEGTKNPQLVLQEQVRKYKQVFIAAQDQVARLDAAVGKFLGQQNSNGPPPGPPPPGPPPNNRPPPGNPAPGRRPGSGGSSDDEDDNQPPRGGGRGFGPPSTRGSRGTGQPSYRGGGPTAAPRRPNGSTFNGAIDENEEDGIPACNCGEPAASRTVRKEGANKGRLFFACSKQMGDPNKCDFFKWDDEGIGSNSKKKQPGGSNGFLVPTAAQSKRGKGKAGGSARGGGRKCSVCKEVGHTKRNCPVSALADMDEEEMQDY